MPKKVKIQYVCQECGNIQAKWSGKCGVCGAWNSLVEESYKPAGSRDIKGYALKPLLFKEIKKTTPAKRLVTKTTEVDRVLGGGIVPGSVLLIAGEPGIGKSTLLLQIAQAIGQTNQVLYVSGEESLQQIKLRADRLQVNANGLELLTSTSIDDIVATISQSNYGLVIIDSIQTMATANLDAGPGTVSQITMSTQLLQAAAKTSHTAILLVGHVTKEGNIAGPKLLEHLVDVVLYLEGERYGGFKILRGIKNRFGSTFEVGIFEMSDRGMLPVTNPSAAFLEERQLSDGSVVVAALEGTRAILVEVQALVNTSPFGYPKRTASGFDLNRLNLLIAVLTKRANINLGNYDVYVNVVGGMRLDEPATDLAVLLAIASAYKAQPVNPDTVVFGEIGLSGEIRSVSQIDKRVEEAKKLGFKQIIAPAYKNALIKPVKNINEALRVGLVSIEKN